MTRQELLNALMYVKPGIATKNSIESMKYYYFSGTHIVSYNDAISIAYPFETDFNAFIEADKLFKVISKLKNDSIVMRMDGDILKVKSGKQLETSFCSISDDNVVQRIETVQESLEGEKKKKLPDNFIESISLCSHVASKNESDGTLSCLYINEDNIIATDNIRISHAKLNSKMEQMLLRASEMKSLLSITPIWYISTKSWIHFINEVGCVFSIRCTKGEYPDMLRFMNFTGVKITLPADILDGVGIASVFVEDDDPSVNVAVKNGVCRVFKKSSAGKVDFRTKIDYKGDKDINFNINYQLLIEMMSHSTEITLADSKAKLHNDKFTMVTTFFQN